jgi:hypothetical protein
MDPAGHGANAPWLDQRYCTGSSTVAARTGLSSMYRLHTSTYSSESTRQAL